MAGKSVSAERCDCEVIHEDIVNSVRIRCQGRDTIELADLFKVFGDLREFEYYGHWTRQKCVFVILLPYLI